MSLPQEWAPVQQTESSTIPHDLTDNSWADQFMPSSESPEPQLATSPSSGLTSQLVEPENPCGKHYKNISYHFKVVSAPRGTLPKPHNFRCPEPSCTYSCLDMRMLARHFSGTHLKEHAEEAGCPTMESFPCSKCDKVFTRIENLVTHHFRKAHPEATDADRRRLKANSEEIAEHNKEQLYRFMDKLWHAKHRNNAPAPELTLGCHHPHVLLRDALSHLHKPKNKACWDLLFGH